MLILPLSNVVHVPLVGDDGNETEQWQHGIATPDGAVASVGGILLGYPATEDPAMPGARAAFDGPFSPESVAAVLPPTTGATSADKLPADWRYATSL